LHVHLVHQGHSICTSANKRYFTYLCLERQNIYKFNATGQSDYVIHDWRNSYIQNGHKWQRKNDIDYVCEHYLTTLSVADYISWSGRISDELERKQLLPNRNTIPEFSWRDSEKPRKSSVRIAVVPARTSTSKIWVEVTTTQGRIVVMFVLQHFSPCNWR
jgi:hypothetical protein